VASAGAHDQRDCVAGVASGAEPSGGPRRSVGEGDEGAQAFGRRGRGGFDGGPRRPVEVQDEWAEGSVLGLLGSDCPDVVGSRAGDIAQPRLSDHQSLGRGPGVAVVVQDQRATDVTGVLVLAYGPDVVGSGGGYARQRPDPFEADLPVSVGVVGHHRDIARPLGKRGRADCPVGTGTDCTDLVERSATGARHSRPPGAVPTDGQSVPRGHRRKANRPLGNDESEVLAPTAKASSRPQAATSDRWLPSPKSGLSTGCHVVPSPRVMCVCSVFEWKRPSQPTAHTSPLAVAYTPASWVCTALLELEWETSCHGWSPVLCAMRAGAGAPCMPTAHTSSPTADRSFTLSSLWNGGG
jgi:hypothetical protein